jgi:hypothetical protein
MQIESWNQVLQLAKDKAESNKPRIYDVPYCWCGKQHRMIIYIRSRFLEEDELYAKYLCDTCFSDKAGEPTNFTNRVCPTCDLHYSVTNTANDLLEPHYGNEMCPICNLLHKCEICGGEKPDNDYRISGVGTRLYICRYCREQLSCCANCATLYAVKKLNIKQGVLKRCYCQYCWPDLSLGYYSFKPTRGIVCYPNHVDFDSEIREMDYKGLLFGIELETELRIYSSRNNIAQTIQDQTPYFYCVHDGSLDNGIEIISVPMSYTWIQKNLCKELEKIRKCKSLSAAQQRKCGMHIHMNRKAITNLQLYKMIGFIEQNKSFCLRISQRKNDSYVFDYARFKDRSSGALITDILDNDPSDQDRYVAINLQTGKTVEIRFFQGTLNPRTVMKNIEFCMALYDFTREVGRKDMYLSKFLEYIKKFAYRYPHFIEFMKYIDMKDIEDTDIPRTSEQRLRILAEEASNNHRIIPMGTPIYTIEPF